MSANLYESLKVKPHIIEAALEHCTTKEQCTGCPLVKASKQSYCGHVLNVETLKYIKILKALNKTFAQRIEELESYGNSDVEQ